MPSDADFVAACRGGDAAAWNALVERFSRYILAIATQAFRLAPHDAEEVFQTVFLRVYSGSTRCARTMRSARGSGSSHATVASISCARQAGRPVEEVEEVDAIGGAAPR